MIYGTNGKPLNIKHFPNGEVDLSGIDTAHLGLTLKWESNADLFDLMLIRKHQKFQPQLRILYMPYSRMDRDAQGGSNCTLRTVGEFIRHLNWKSIEVVDPHSELTLAYLGTDAISSYPFESFSEEVFKKVGDLSEAVVMFPDAGAQKRYSKMPIFEGYEQIVGFKERDFTTGKITGYQIGGGSNVRGRKVVIVDDLCSYGGTFLAAASALNEYEPEQIILVVSHCEDSIWNGKMFKKPYLINHIVTTDSLLDTGFLCRLDPACEVHKMVHVKTLRRSCPW